MIAFIVPSFKIGLVFPGPVLQIVRRKPVGYILETAVVAVLLHVRNQFMVVFAGSLQNEFADQNVVMNELFHLKRSICHEYVVGALFQRPQQTESVEIFDALFEAVDGDVQFPEKIVDLFVRVQ